VSRIDTSVPVVVLKLYHHCAMGIVRSLGRLGVPIYGVHRDPREPVARSRYCRKAFVWDVDSAPEAETALFLLEVAREIGGCPLLVSTDDGNNGLLFRQEKSLREAYRFPEVPANVVFDLYSKKGMYFLAKRYGVPTPETTFPKSRSEVLHFLTTAVFPVALKGIDSRLLHQRTGTRMLIVQNERELLEAYDQLEDPACPNLMLQEYIPGGTDSVWMFDGYFNAKSECLAAFTGQKVRQYPVYTGMTSLGICRKNETVEKITRDFLKALGYSGMVDIGYRYDVRDGLYKLLDVNPRIGATFRLFVDPRNGMDILRAFYLDMTGQAVPPSTLCEGRKWIVEDNDLLSFRHSHKEGKLRLKEWISSYRGVQEGAWFAWDDPRPFALRSATFMRRFWKRPKDKDRGSSRQSQAGGKLESTSSPAAPRDLISTR
jgi:predicted ATP-grasp superfamily ATP-dependent carboligase